MCGADFATRATDFAHKETKKKTPEVILFFRFHNERFAALKTAGCCNVLLLSCRRLKRSTK
jgi:hypothetical protein